MIESLDQRVRKRARYRCEYCKIPALVSELTFPLDHIIAQQHGGETTFENLALSCPHCNYHKGPNLAGIDPQTRKLTRLFTPRRNRWASHFGWDGSMILGKTAVGRTTLYVLDMNHPDRAEVRRLLIEAGLFPKS
ncbi:MAG: HNH endonuclease signature motif containing protein [Isosphaeraceae bacterium]